MSQVIIDSERLETLIRLSVAESICKRKPFSEAAAHCVEMVLSHAKKDANEFSGIFELFYVPLVEIETIKPSYFLSRVNLCCKSLAWSFDSQKISVCSVVGLSYDYFRVKMDSQYIKACPYCSSRIVCHYAELPGVLKGITHYLNEPVKKV